MRLLWVTTLLVSAVTAALDVERTVRQVQIILQSNSNLPRLSREEIIELLNDIRAEDAKSKSSSTEISTENVKATASYFSYDANEETSSEINKPKTSYFSYSESENDAVGKIKTTTSYFTYDGNESATEIQETKDNIVANNKDNTVTVTPPTEPETTTKAEPNVMVVLPYTPRDGSSLQELYTKPPRTEVLPESKASPKPFTLSAQHELHETLQNNAKLANNINKQALDFPAELQAFLDSHGLKGNPGQDNFLLPLDGFKPLPPAKVVDESVQLPENILLSYDLIAPVSDPKESSKPTDGTASGFLYEPLRPEFPFELQTSSSEKKKAILPYDMPTRKNKSPTTKKPNYDPIDYDSVRVIPLNKGPNPLDDDKYDFSNEVGKRQTNVTAENPTTESSGNDSTTVSTPTDDTKSAITNPPSTSDSVGSDSGAGASIADLEDSFGGAAPEQPGDSELPPPRKNGFYWMVDWNSFLEVGDGDTKVNIRFEPKLGDPQMFLPVNVP